MQYYLMLLLVAAAVVNMSSVHDLNELRGYPDANQDVEYKYNCDTPDGIAAMLRDLDDETISAICAEENP